jgi:hypothetical protein
MGILKSLQEIEAYFRQEYDNTGSRKFKRYAADIRLAQVMLTPEAYFAEIKKTDEQQKKEGD